MALQSFMSLPPGAPRRQEALSTTHQATFIQGIVLRASTIWNNKRGCLICSETFHLSSGWLQSSHLIWQGSGPTPQPSSLCLFGTYAHWACRQLVPPHMCLPHLSSGVPQAQDHDPSSPGPLQNSPASATTPQKSPPHSGQDRLLKAQMEPTSPVPQIPSMASPFLVPPHVPFPHPQCAPDHRHISRSKGGDGPRRPARLPHMHTRFTEQSLLSPSPCEGFSTRGLTDTQSPSAEPVLCTLKASEEPGGQKSGLWEWWAEGR